MSNVDLNFSKVSQEEWKQLVQAELKGRDFNETLVWQSLEGLNVKPYFSKEDINYADLKPLNKYAKTSMIAKYHDLFFNDVDGFIIDKEVNQEEFYNKVFFLTDENFKVNAKSDNYLLFDLFTEAEKKANYNPDIEKAKKILSNTVYKKSLLIDVSLHQNAGANIFQQLGIVLAKANEYVNILGKSCLDKIYFKFSIGYNYFFEIAKLRAFRILWSNFISQYQYDAEPYILCESSLRNKSTLDSENNLIRSTFEGAVAFIGNADALFLHEYSGWNTDNSIMHETAYKQQLVLKEESILDKFSDAMKGSYYVEFITNFLVKQAWEFFLEIEKEGGYLRSLENGFTQKRIITQAQKEQEAFDTGKLILIGVNKFPKEAITKEPKKVNYNPKLIQEIRLAESLE
ncbi:MAG: methylmalonyl-CoA mutase family protein [Flavobacteriaceae bacterium]|jgi:methylmalonyl-CoA mutase|nr:methylmalonyl-CoA mutase family protein [Flavobacteriaceae bacterium]